MKKLISLFLVLIMLCVCMMTGFSAYAYEEDEDEIIDGLDEEEIMNNPPVYSIEQEFEDHGILFLLTSAASASNPVYTVEDFDESLGVASVRRITSDGAKNHIFYVELDKHDKQNVLDVIEELNKMSGILCAEPNFRLYPDESKQVSEELLNAIKEYENKEDITVDDIILQLDNIVSTNKHLVSYSIKNRLYRDDIVEIRVGVYKFRTGRPIPMIFTNGALYDVREAYETGVIDDFDLLSLSTFQNINFEKVELIYGDANGDWCLDILDATHIQRHLAQLNEDFIDLELCDIDEDGDVSIMDATAIQRRLAKLDVPVATPDEV